MERTVVAEGVVILKEAGMVKVVGEMVTTVEERQNGVRTTEKMTHWHS